MCIRDSYEGSPAEDAGLKDGDVIVYVDEIEASSLELTELVTHIRGEEGTTVHLKVYREGENDYVEMDVKRENIDLPTIEHKMLEGNIGYIHIVDFGAPTVEQFEAAVDLSLIHIFLCCTLHCIFSTAHCRSDRPL